MDRDRELERDREIFRIRDRRRLESFREDLKSLERDKTDGLTSDGSKKLNQPSQNPVVLGDDLEFWVERVCLFAYLLNYFCFVFLTKDHM